MRTKILIITALVAFCNITQTYAQDAATFLSQAAEALDKKDCKTAEKKYKIWAALTGESNANFQQLIDECKKEEKRKADSIAFATKYTNIPGTNLMITKQPVAYNITVKDADYMCLNLRYGGFTNWRLPTKNELFTIFSSGKNNGNNLWGGYGSYSATIMWYDGETRSYNNNSDTYKSGKCTCYCVRDIRVTDK